MQCDIFIKIGAKSLPKPSQGLELWEGFTPFAHQF